MGQYSKSDLQLLCDQINRDNPTLDSPLTPANIILLGTPGAGANGRNTTIRLNGVGGIGFAGKRTFSYDRMNLGTLYATVPTALAIAFPNEVVTVADALPTINAAFGILLSAEGINSPGTVLPQGKTPTTLSITVTATNLSFTGTLTFKWRRGAAGIYPQSGPGTKEMLIGDLTLGYFGAVPLSAMFSAGEFFSQIMEGHSRGTALPRNDPSIYFLKFAIDGKFVFFPSKALVSSISWEQIYKMGAIDASGADAAFPPLSGNGVLQNALVQTTDGQSWLRARLAYYSDVDPEAVIKGVPTSEVERLFKKVHTGAGGTGEWDTLPVGGTGLDITSPFLFLNSLAGTTSKAHYCSLNQATLSTLDKTTVALWRPMFVYAEKSTLLLPPGAPAYDLLNVPKAIAVDYTERVHAAVPEGVQITLEGYAPVIGWTHVDAGHISPPADMLYTSQQPSAIFVTHTTSLPSP